MGFRIVSRYIWSSTAFRAPFDPVPPRWIRTAAATCIFALVQCGLNFEVNAPLADRDGDVSEVWDVLGAGTLEEEGLRNAASCAFGITLGLWGSAGIVGCIVGPAADEC